MGDRARERKFQSAVENAGIFVDSIHLCGGDRYRNRFSMGFLVLMFTQRGRGEKS